MFKCLLENFNDIEFFRKLPGAVRKARDRMQLEKPGRVVNARLVHAVTFQNEQMSSTASLRFSDHLQNKEGIADPQSAAIQIPERDYSVEVITALVGEAVTETNTLMNNALLCGNHMETEEIAASVENFIKSYLTSIVKIETGYNVSVLIQSGEVSQVIVTVA